MTDEDAADIARFLKGALFGLAILAVSTAAGYGLVWWVTR